MSCLQDYIRMAEAHEQKVLANCPTCKQQYFGVMTVTMARKQFEEAKSEKQLHLWEIEESGLLRKLQTDENLVLEEGSQAQQLHDCIQIGPRVTGPLLGIAQVTRNIQVGKQAGFLKHIGNRPLVAGQMLPLVQPCLAIEGNCATDLRLQPGNTAQQGGFT